MPPRDLSNLMRSPLLLTRLPKMRRRLPSRKLSLMLRIRQKKLLVHNEALKDIERIKADAQKEHDKINKKTQEETQKAIAKAQAGVKGLTE